MRRKRMEQEALVNQFATNSYEYVKIRKAAEEKVRSTLLNMKSLVELALLSITESIRENQEKYGSLIYDALSFLNLVTIMVVIVEKIR
jgi:hypothetical protein